MLLTNLASVLQAASLPIVETPSWAQRGDGPMETPLGVIFHDTVGRPPPDDHSDIAVILNGRPGLPPPLAHLFLSRSGVFHVVAAGKANHAGYGELDGHLGVFNRRLLGIEAENMGDGVDPWPEVQMTNGAKGCAALAKAYGFDLAHVLGHKEYARFPSGPNKDKPGRKVDPSFDMTVFRTLVASFM